MTDESSQAEESDKPSMFASVWVKVEVSDEDEGEHALRPSTLRQRERERRRDMDDRKPKKRVRKRAPPAKNLECDKCDYKTGYKNCLELHMLGHTKIKPLSCTFCEYTTKYPTSLQRHIMIQHEFKNGEVKFKLQTYECPQCPYKTHFKWNLNAHKRKHSLEKKFKCDHCEYTTAYKHNHIKHSKVHRKEETAYQCDKCPFTTKFEGHITRHLAKIHNEVSERANRCENCPFSTKTKWRLNIHRNRSKQEKVIKCGYCDFESHYMCEYKNHRIDHIDKIRTSKWLEHTKTKGLSYDIPREFLNTDQELEPFINTAPQEVHLDIDVENQTQHEKDNHYLIDPACEVEWSNIPVNESMDTERPFRCTRCDYSAKFKASVQRHYQRHHTSQNRPYQCLNCDFSTKTKDQITLHNKRSQCDEILVCTVCQFKTNFKCKSIMHQRSHYPFKCTACEYTCKQKYEIQKHFATIHLGNGLKCQYCDYKATRKESLLCHEAIHTGNKPFKCEECDYKSVRRSLLDNHIRRHHSNRTEVTIINDSKIQSLKVAPELTKRDEEMYNFCTTSSEVNY